MPCSCAMVHMIAGSTAPPRCVWRSMSTASSPRSRRFRAAPFGFLADRASVLFARGRTAHAATAPRRLLASLGMLGPERVAVVVGRGELAHAVPDLEASQLL